MMHMTLYWGRNVTILFDWWRTESWTSYALTLLACFLVSAFYQYLEDQRFRLKSGATPPVAASDETPFLRESGISRRTRRIAAAAMFGISSTIGYFLMLSIMSYNGGVFSAVVLGLSVGYFVFRTGYEEEEEKLNVVVENSCACS